MKVYTYSQARQKLSELLDEALTEEVLIRRRDGTVFSVVPKQSARSPFDIEGIPASISTEDIVNAVRESRERYKEQENSPD
ncbi:MAG: prevent-host-death protein [Anaerolineaceae bacterium]|nr:prevent-host-death protein [Anaerolineaceae bacterium]